MAYVCERLPPFWMCEPDFTRAVAPIHIAVHWSAPGSRKMTVTMELLVHDCTLPPKVAAVTVGATLVTVIVSVAVCWRRRRRR